MWKTEEAVAAAAKTYVESRTHGAYKALVHAIAIHENMPSYTNGTLLLACRLKNRSAPLESMVYSDSVTSAASELEGLIHYYSVSPNRIQSIIENTQVRTVDGIKRKLKEQDEQKENP